MENILYYYDTPSWRPQVGRMLSDIFTPEVLSALKKYPLDEMWTDEFDWLDTLVSSVLGRHVSIRGIMEMRFQEFFGYIAGHHACRTGDIDSYYKSGLIPLSRAKANQELRDHFLNSKFPELTEEILEEAILGMRPVFEGYDSREGKIYLGLDPDWLIHHASHYLHRGGEYKQGVASQMSQLVNERSRSGDRVDYSSVFESIGLPTIFVCRVPLDMISDDTLESIHRFLVCHYVGYSVHGSESYLKDVTITLREPLGPDCIIEHYHPWELGEAG
jgi:hypothetical protein